MSPTPSTSFNLPFSITSQCKLSNSTIKPWEAFSVGQKEELLPSFGGKHFFKVDGEQFHVFDSYSGTSMKLKLAYDYVWEDTAFWDRDIVTLHGFSEFADQKGLLILEIKNHFTGTQLIIAEVDLDYHEQKLYLQKRVKSYKGYELFSTHYLQNEVFMVLAAKSTPVHTGVIYSNGKITETAFNYTTDPAGSIPTESRLITVENETIGFISNGITIGGYHYDGNAMLFVTKLAEDLYPLTFNNIDAESFTRYLGQYKNGALFVFYYDLSKETEFQHVVYLDLTDLQFYNLGLHFNMKYIFAFKGDMLYAVDRTTNTVERYCFGGVENLEALSRYEGENYGALKGFVGEDTVTVFKSFKGLFGVVNHQSSRLNVDLDGSTVAGRFGFGRSVGLANLKKNLLAQYATGANLCLGVKVAADNSRETVVNMGEKVFLDANKLLEVESSNTHVPRAWELSVTAFKVGTLKLEKTAPAILSTTLKGINAPKKIFDTLIGYFGATLEADTKLYSVDCNKNTDLKITVGDKDIDIRFDAITEKVGDKCILNIQQNDNNRKVNVGAALFVGNGICLQASDSTITVYNSAATS
ncbi:unnamed protein product [Bursaphelenchus okinawaensis]|uniref:Peptidase A1 domain-containing protein n=1 Tax=Bursaphelenchus okinawaensis TaxID=465554 RepID=A0A811K0R3_9BILA|nr:unnamed protein product [Bursaphelenchus okinawaensis]CAG9088396.1 unnamed protein product [Bursaphelenchus okinawaensis]